MPKWWAIDPVMVIFGSMAMGWWVTRHMVKEIMAMGMVSMGTVSMGMVPVRRGSMRMGSVRMIPVRRGSMRRGSMVIVLTETMIMRVSMGPTGAKMGVMTSWPWRGP